MGYDSENVRLEYSARAAWLYFVAGKTQEEISRELKVSRPTAQRLVSSAVSQRLVTFRFEHPIAACMQLAERMKHKYELRTCWIVPSDQGNSSSLKGIGNALAGIVDTVLSAQMPSIAAFGTGRSLRAGIDLLQPFAGQHHTLVALVGNIAPDGSASRFDVITRLAGDKWRTSIPNPASCSGRECGAAGATCGPPDGKART
jgi:DNA-binding transcriptional regulator LsrR (DeoR family)